MLFDQDSPFALWLGKLGRVPGWIAADAGFYSQANEEAVQAVGVKYVSIPNRNTRSTERRRWEKQRWFKKGQRWRTGSEGRISVLKRRHGLSRCRELPNRCPRP